MAGRLKLANSGHAKTQNGSGVEIYLPDVPLPSGIPTGMIAISDMANIFGVTHRTLHFYEEKQLLVADRIGIMRVYSRYQVRRMAAINICREIGMPIAVIQELMDSLADSDSQAEADQLFRDALVTRKRELLANESTIRRQMQQINSLLEDKDQLGDASETAKTPYLTEIELKCIALMAEGYATTRLARVLGIDYDEIVSIEKNIIRKFGANNRFQAVAKAVLLGLIKDP